MSTGSVGRLVRNHGFGFIKIGDGIDLFFHHSEVQNVSFDSLEEGQGVEFKISLSSKGLKATDVRLLKENSKHLLKPSLVQGSTTVAQPQHYPGNS